MRSSLEIAQEAELRPIQEIAAAAGLEDNEVEPYGRYKAKVGLSVLERLKDKPDGKIICVTAITPTKAGEGKTTTSVSLTQGMGAIGEQALLCLREASLGPVFGIKGGAAGAGYAQVVPMEDLNLHFTGDMHAISAANNLLAAFLDAHVHARQRARHRPALDLVAPLRRHERSRPAADHHGPRRRHQRLAARDGLRHHGRLRGHGDPRARARSRPTCASGSARSPSPTAARAIRSPRRTSAARAR